MERTAPAGRRATPCPHLVANGPPPDEAADRRRAGASGDVGVTGTVRLTCGAVGAAPPFAGSREAVGVVAQPEPQLVALEGRQDSVGHGYSVHSAHRRRGRTDCSTSKPSVKSSRNRKSRTKATGKDGRGVAVRDEAAGGHGACSHSGAGVPVANCPRALAHTRP